MLHGMKHEAPTPAPNTRPELNNVITEKDAARYLSRSRSFLRIARMHDRGPAYVRLGTRAIGYRLRDLDAYLDARVVRTSDAA